MKLLQQSLTAMASPGETASALPQYQRVMSSLYRERMKRFPLMPSTRGDIDLDGQWTTTVQGDRFLLGEDGDGADKIIAFASNSALHALANADTYHMDGTNNHVEGYHTRLMRKAGKIHPNIFEVVEMFSQEEAASLVSILQLQSGQPAPKHRKKYINLHARLDELGLEYMLCDRGIESYLSAIGHMMDNFT